jgi:hypothetical protein
MDEYAGWLLENGILKDSEGWKGAYTNDFLPRARLS